MIEFNILKEKFEYNNNILVKKDILKFDRQIKAFASSKNVSIEESFSFQEKLKKSKVAILCVGGVGSYLAISLAVMVIGEIRMIDDDSIEISNTSRQILYEEIEIGKFKLDIAKNKLEKYNPDGKIKILKKFIDRSNDEEVKEFLKGVDLIILTADNPRGKIQYIVDEIALELNTPWILGSGYSVDKISVGPIIIPHKTRSYKEIFPVLNENFKDKDFKTYFENLRNSFSSAVFDSFNGLAGQALSVEVLKFLTEFSQSKIIEKMLFINTENWEISIKEI